MHSRACLMAGVCRPSLKFTLPRRGRIVALGDRCPVSDDRRLDRTHPRCARECHSHAVRARRHAGEGLAPRRDRRDRPGGGIGPDAVGSGHLRVAGLQKHQAGHADEQDADAPGGKSRPHLVSRSNASW